MRNYSAVTDESKAARSEVSTRDRHALGNIKHESPHYFFQKLRQLVIGLFNGHNKSSLSVCLILTHVLLCKLYKVIIYVKKILH